MKKCVSAFAVICLSLCVEASAQSSQRIWPAHMSLVSGPGMFCTQGSVVTIREGDGKFALYNQENRGEIWTIAQAADGSVSGETRQVGNNRPIRITVPAGTAPRGFDTLDLAQACRFRIEPR